MKHIFILAAFLPFLLANSCTTLSEVRMLPPTDIRPYFDSKLLEKCKRPVKIPERVLDQLEVEEYWMIDRKNLIVCGDRHSALGNSIKFRDKQGNNTPITKPQG